MTRLSNLSWLYGNTEFEKINIGHLDVMIILVIRYMETN